MQRLKQKKILITGGTSGIGFETARQCLAEGAEVALTGRRPEAVKAAVDDLGGGVLGLVSNAGSITDQTALADELTKVWGHLDAVYINAGDVTHASMGDWREDAFDRIIDTNLKGPFFLLQALMPLMSEGASVILCTSVSIHLGLAQSSVYAASKAGLASLARTLSGEWIDRGIRVNSLCPGPTRTSALDKLGLSPDAERALQDEIAELVPLGRMGEAQELAKAAVFLASDESRFIVGTELIVDGGTANL